MGLIQSRFVQSPLIHGGGALKAATAPASFIFNGTDEYLTTEVDASSPSTTIFTYSFWVKSDEASPERNIIGAYLDSDNHVAMYVTAGDLVIQQRFSASSEWVEFCSHGTINAWHHWVIRYDSTQGTADNRIRFYKDGTLVSDGGTQPSASEVHRLFTSGWNHTIGRNNFAGDFFDGKFAFIDVLDGVSAAPTEFAFDDGGTWTQMSYAGSYGNNGFGIDGSDGFNTTAGAAIAFTGNNMTVGDNLDFSDLPPHTV